MGKGVYLFPVAKRPYGNPHLTSHGKSIPSADDLDTLRPGQFYWDPQTGVYFRCVRYIEPMTKLALSFDVPTATEVAPVSCEGIVARVVPELPDDAVDSYEVAVFFTTIDAESLHHLERYVEAVLTA